jgi:hypothetical protein
MTLMMSFQFTPSGIIMVAWLIKYDLWGAKYTMTGYAYMRSEKQGELCMFIACCHGNNVELVAMVAVSSSHCSSARNGQVSGWVVAASQGQ